MEHIKWIFSGIGILIITGILGIIRWLINRKKSKKELPMKPEETPKENIDKSVRKVNQYGDKSTYVEKNEGDININ